MEEEWFDGKEKEKEENIKGIHLGQDNYLMKMN